MAENPVEETAKFLYEQVVNAFTRSDPVDGMKASATLFVITFASSLIGLWFTIVLDVLFAFLFMIHAGRYLWGEYR